MEGSDASQVDITSLRDRPHRGIDGHCGAPGNSMPTVLDDDGDGSAHRDLSNRREVVRGAKDAFA